MEVSAERLEVRREQQHECVVELQRVGPPPGRRAADRPMRGFELAERIGGARVPAVERGEWHSRKVLGQTPTSSLGDAGSSSNAAASLCAASALDL